MLTHIHSPKKPEFFSFYFFSDHIKEKLWGNQEKEIIYALEEKINDL
jgi:hypothetical protein